jgi:hypothetical protein
MTQTQHTATPWIVEEVKTSCGRAFKINDKPDQKYGIIACIYDDNTSLNERNHQEHEANAEFIVRACNSHDQLVAALNEIEWIIERETHAADMLAFIEKVAAWDFAKFGSDSTNESIYNAQHEAFELIKKVRG